jgi:uncharacterized protein
MTLSTEILIEISAVMLLAATFRTAFGFGEALIAVPLLSLILPVKVAAPIAVLASVIIALAAVIKDRQHIHFASATRLLLATACGIPFGLLVLKYLSEGATKAALGVLLLFFAGFSLVNPDSFKIKSERYIWLFGFLAGIAGGSYGMNGPPLAIYGAGRGWSGNQFRATIQAYFLPASLLGLVGYYSAGLWTKEVNILFADALPAIAVGILCGNSLAKFMEGTKFTRYLYGALVIVACVLVFQALEIK